MASYVNKLPPKYAVADWVTSNKLISLNAERIRDSSHTIRQDARRLRNETDNHTRWTQHDSNTKLEKRIDDINDWKRSLERCLEETDKEIKSLENEKKNVEIALEAKKIPLHVALECLMLREEREGIDLVRDEVEHQLQKEVELIEEIKGLLHQKISESFEQLCLLEEGRHQLHGDVTDKTHALGIDGECYNLNNESKDINFQINPTRTVKGSVTPETWNAFSEYNKNRGEMEMKASQRLREAIFVTLENARNDLDAQHRATNYSYRKRIHETEQAKIELEWQKRNTEDEIATMEQDIAGLKESIEAKIGPMMVAQTRLEKRTQRRNVELCRDISQYQLCHEVSEIDGSVKALSEKHAVAETALKSLLQDLARVTEDLAIKTKSLALDTQCVELREKLTESLNENTGLFADQATNHYTSVQNSNTERASPISAESTRNRETLRDHQSLGNSLNIDNNSKSKLMLESTYNVDYDETKNKRFGDLQRTLGQTKKVVELA